MTIRLNMRMALFLGTVLLLTLLGVAYAAGELSNREVQGSFVLGTIATEGEDILLHGDDGLPISQISFVTDDNPDGEIDVDINGDLVGDPRQDIWIDMDMEDRPDSPIGITLAAYNVTVLRDGEPLLDGAGYQLEPGLELLMGYPGEDLSTDFTAILQANDGPTAVQVSIRFTEPPQSWGAQEGDQIAFTALFSANEVGGGGYDFPGNVINANSLPFHDQVNSDGRGFEEGEPNRCGNVGNTVWYQFTPDRSMFVNARMYDADFSDVIAFFSGNQSEGFDGLEYQGCWASSDGRDFEVTEGITYYMQAGGQNGTSGQFDFEFSEIFPDVTNHEDDGDGSLRRAIADAEDGDEIDFAPGFSATIYLQSPLVIDKNLTIWGPGQNNLYLDGQGDVRVLEIPAETDVDVVSLTIRNGYTDQSGGGILNQGNLTLWSTDVSGNVSDERGGGIYNQATLHAYNSTVSGNVSNDGGAIHNLDTLILNQSIVRGNSGTNGGGIYNSNAGTLDLYNSDIEGNAASENAGGIFNMGETSLAGTTMQANTTAGHGGAIYIFGGEVTVTNSTISNNDGGFGEAFYVRGTQPRLNLNNSTIVGNEGNLIWCDCEENTDYRTIIIRGTLIANGDSRDCNLTNADDNVQSNGYNLATEHNCGLDTTTDQIVNDAEIGILSLRYVTGPTMTHPLIEGSPAIDAIPTSECELDRDQRGEQRPQGEGCDIGAFEGSVPPPPTNDDFPGMTVNLEVPDGTVAGIFYHELNNQSAGLEENEPGYGGHSVWYQFTPTSDQAGLIHAWTKDSDFDTRLLVITAGADQWPIGNGDPGWVVENDDALGGVQSHVQWDAIGGVTYYIQASGYGTSFGNLKFQVHEDGAAGTIGVSGVSEPITSNDKSNK